MFGPSIEAYVYKWDAFGIVSRITASGARNGVGGVAIGGRVCRAWALTDGRKNSYLKRNTRVIYIFIVIYIPSWGDDG